MPYTKVLIHYSVSYSSIDKVRAYILIQSEWTPMEEEHHKKKTFSEEYQEFLTAHQFETVLAKANTNSVK